MDSPAEPTETHGDQIHQLESKVGQLEQAVESHASIDQAMGVIVAVGRISPAEAWDVLRETSMDTNIKLRQVAELVVAWGATGDLAADIRDELARRLRHRGAA
ncbi:ANTAR domain-containing protein [Streptomyces blattellae]|uniref:ANTAR domain-containing protein n=1 Tax=Streptomyces blattellae TaxID=2569855 RepID=UPI001E33DC9F|nr:ANTAR domain-containing protein [Streptomyces blattellae]